MCGWLRYSLLGLLPSSIREIAQSHQAVEQELAHAVNASSKAMDRVYGKARTAEVPGLLMSAPRCLLLPWPPHAVCLGSLQGLNYSFVQEIVNNVRALRSETELLLAGKMALVSSQGPRPRVVHLPWWPLPSCVLRCLLSQLLGIRTQRALLDTLPSVIFVPCKYRADPECQSCCLSSLLALLYPVLRT